jgi:hypothetical protein
VPAPGDDFGRGRQALLRGACASPTTSGPAAGAVGRSRELRLRGSRFRDCRGSAHLFSLGPFGAAPAQSRLTYSRPLLRLARCSRGLPLRRSLQALSLPTEICGAMCPSRMAPCLGGSRVLFRTWAARHVLPQVQRCRRQARARDAAGRRCCLLHARRASALAQAPSLLCGKGRQRRECTAPLFAACFLLRQQPFAPDTGESSGTVPQCLGVSYVPRRLPEIKALATAGVRPPSGRRSEA